MKNASRQDQSGWVPQVHPSIAVILPSNPANWFWLLSSRRHLFVSACHEPKVSFLPETFLSFWHNLVRWLQLEHIAFTLYIKGYRCDRWDILDLAVCQSQHVRFHTRKWLPTPTRVIWESTDLSLYNPTNQCFFSWLTSPLTLDLSFEARSCDALHPLPCENEVKLGNTTAIFADLHFKS